MTILGILRTPLLELLRGRVVSVHAARDVLAASRLPAPIVGLVTRLVKRTRLKAGEQLALAHELISHFTEALAAGQTPEGAIAAFGDERVAARLIRRAVIRKRPWYWHVGRALKYSLGGLVVLYAASTAYFMLGRPTISVDYAGKLEQVSTVPEAERAWPLYRRALINFGFTHVNKAEATARYKRIEGARAGWTHYSGLKAFLAAHTADLELIRQGSLKPHLGFVMGVHGSADDPELYGPWNRSEADPEDLLAASVISMPLPHLNDLRICTTLLSDESTFALEAGDVRRVKANVESQIRLAGQVRDGPFLVPQMVGIGIRSSALRDVDRLLQAWSREMSDGDLIELAHFISGPRVPADLMSFASERYIFYDLIQRSYTHDGNGDGRITPAGFRVLQRMSRDAGRSYAGSGLTTDTARFLAGGAAPFIVASRRDLLAKYDGLINAAEENLHLPARDHRENELDHEVAQLRGNLAYLPIPMLVPALSRAGVSADRCIAKQEALTTAIALELFRRHHEGRYPAELTELVPAYLPQVPKDHVTGDTLKFRLDERGRPLLYSVGTDRVDDHGRPPISKSGRPEPWAAAEIKFHPDCPKGDWLLYPDPRDESADEPADGPADEP